jgi:hypothetical protein
LIGCDGAVLLAITNNFYRTAVLEKEISSSFTRSDDEFYRALSRVKDEVLAQKDAPFAGIQYDTIFDVYRTRFSGHKLFLSRPCD